MEKVLFVNEEELSALQNSLEYAISFWEERLEKRRGENTENVILARLSSLRSLNDKTKLIARMNTHQ